MPLTGAPQGKQAFNYVWDVDLLIWVKQTAAGAGGGTVVDQGAAGTDPWLVTGTVATGGLTDTQLRASDVKITLDGEVVPVTGTFFQATQPISGTVTANLGTLNGVATSAKQDTGNTSLANLDTKTPALGQALAAASTPVVLTAAQVTTLTPPAAITGFLSESDFDTKAGSLTETAPATDTASSGLNGRLQRIAQRITSLIAALGSPFQAGGSIGNTTFASTIADAANVTFGAKADAKSTATDTTAITAMSVWKQISASVQLMVFGSGTAAAAQRVVLATDTTVPNVTGNVAHNSSDSGNPIKMGAKALSFGANPTGVTTTYRTDIYSTVAGQQWVLSGHPNIITRRDNYTTAQTDTKLITVAGGTKIVVVACTIICDAAGTTKPLVRAGFAATTTPTTTGVYISHPGLNAGSGVREAGAVAGADGDDYIFTCAVPTGGSIDVVTKYFTIES